MTGARIGLEVGAVAPDFTLRDQFGQDVSLSTYRGDKAVALVFYPYAFSGVCTGEMAGIRDRLAALALYQHNARVNARHYIDGGHPDRPFRVA